jgi:hypothetical protein
LACFHQHRVISALQNQFAEVEATEAETEHNIKGSLAQFMLFTMRNKQNITNHFKTIEKMADLKFLGTIS